jgi:hypothetical protein
MMASIAWSGDKSEGLAETGKGHPTGNPKEYPPKGIFRSMVRAKGRGTTGGKQKKSQPALCHKRKCVCSAFRPNKKTREDIPVLVNGHL